MMHISRTSGDHKRQISGLFLILIAWSLLPLTASTVERVSIEELARNSELIFEGRVTHVVSGYEPNGNIYTYVTFEILDLLKGRYPGSRVELRFLGGRVGDIALSVGDGPYPESGERGIYFVESASRRLANPLYGGTQGHLLVTQDPLDPQMRVTTRSGKQIVSIERAASDKVPGLSTGNAMGLRLAEENKGIPQEGLNASDFKLRLRDLIRSPR